MAGMGINELIISAFFTLLSIIATKIDHPSKEGKKTKSVSMNLKSIVLKNFPQQSNLSVIGFVLPVDYEIPGVFQQFSRV